MIDISWQIYSSFDIITASLPQCPLSVIENDYMLKLCRSCAVVDDLWLLADHQMSASKHIRRVYYGKGGTALHEP